MDKDEIARLTSGIHQIDLGVEWISGSEERNCSVPGFLDAIQSIQNSAELPDLDDDS